jgi:hypothetical protein
MKLWRTELQPFNGGGIMGNDPKKCEWRSQAAALSEFANFGGKTQSAEHIKPLHWYVACRLVVEGGFLPDDITPRPPFHVEWPKKGAPILHYDQSRAGTGERTVLGGLKTKQVDVVVTRDSLGPVLAVSCKGVTGAFRNLTNRLEETIGECTNLHITYPALVLGYLVVLRANRLVEEALDQAEEAAGSAGAGEEGAKELKRNDIAMQDDGSPAAGIVRFHNALRELVGRRGIRDDISRYEAIGFGLVEMEQASCGELVSSYPPEDSPLLLKDFFNKLYARYDERFVYSAPDLKATTGRLEWSAESPVLNLPGLDYAPRIAG